MTLQTSGAISLGNIQTEFGGSNPISMSEYVKGGSYVPSTATNTNIPSTTSNMSFSKFYGGSVVSYLDTQTVTVGSRVVGGGPGGINTVYSGFSGFLSTGSITDGTSNLYSGASILELNYNTNTGTGNYISFSVEGLVSNSGWTNIIIGGVSFARADAIYTLSGGSTPQYTTWNIATSATNPFGGAGSVVTVNWN